MSYEIELKELPDRYVVTIRLTTTPDKLGEVFMEVLPEVDACRRLVVMLGTILLAALQ